MLSIFGCGISQPLVEAPAANSRQFRSRPVAYPASAAATPRTQSEAVQPNPPEPERSITQEVYRTSQPRPPARLMSYYPTHTPTLTFVPSHHMYHPMPMMTSMMPPVMLPAEQSLDWVLMPSQFPSAQMRMGMSAMNHPHAYDAELTLPQGRSSTTTSSSDTSIHLGDNVVASKFEAPFTKSQDRDCLRYHDPVPSNYTQPLDCASCASPSQLPAPSERPRKNWGKVKLMHYQQNDLVYASQVQPVPPVEELAEAPQPDQHTQPLSPKATLPKACSMFETQVSNALGTSAPVIETHHCSTLAIDVAETSSRPINLSAIWGHEPCDVSDVPSIAKDGCGKELSTSSIDSYPHEAVPTRMCESGTDPLSPLAQMHRIDYEINECPCQKCALEASRDFNCTLNFWKKREVSSPPTSFRRTGSSYAGQSRMTRDTQPLPPTSDPLGELSAKTPERRKLRQEGAEAVCSAVESSTPIDEGDSVPTEGRIVRRMTRSPGDENVPPSHFQRDIYRTLSAQDDAIDRALRSALQTAQKGCDVRADFIRMKRGFYAVTDQSSTVPATAPIEPGRFATAVPRRRSCHVDEAFAMKTDRTAFSRPLLSASTMDPRVVPDVFCFVQVTVIDEARVSLRILDRREVMKNFGSTAVCKWLRPENTFFLGGSRTRSLSLSRPQSSKSEALSLPSGGSRDDLWKNGNYARLNEFLHFFRACAMKKSGSLAKLRPKAHRTVTPKQRSGLLTSKSDKAH